MATTSGDSNKGILLEAGTNEVEFLEFSLGKQHYGINVSKIKQILVYDEREITELSTSKDALTGLYYFRGAPVPVVDLRSYLRVRHGDAEVARRLLIVTELNQHVVAFVVDEVNAITRCSWKDFTPLSGDYFTDSDTNVVGTLKMKEHVVLILDIESVVSQILPSASMDQFVDKISKSEGQSRSSIRVVYCEDSPIVQKILVKALHGAGFNELQGFANGAEALKYITSSENKGVDVIISDIEMPNMDGLSFCKAVRSLPEYKKTPFIFFSSMISEEMKRKCTFVGGDASFSKPEVNKIVESIDQFVKK